MNSINHYIIELYNYMLNYRDTLEYAVEKEHSFKLYSTRKAFISDGLKEGYAMGNFLKNNGEKGEELKKKFQEFIDDYYSENSSIIKVSEENVRVDHTQHIKMFTDVVPQIETLRDILSQYLVASEKNNEADPAIRDLFVLDDRMFRLVFFMLGVKEYIKSFMEFNKVMTESKGARTPQSNFIVQNELSVLGKLLRDVRSHHRFIDNETLDILDESLKVVEICEGRRERFNNKSLKEIFDDINAKLTNAVKNIEDKWKLHYTNLLSKLRDEINGEAKIETQNIKA